MEGSQAVSVMGRDSLICSRCGGEIPSGWPVRYSGGYVVHAMSTMCDPAGVEYGQDLDQRLNQFLAAEGAD